MCFRFREGLPNEASTIKSTQSDIFRTALVIPKLISTDVANFSQEVSLTPRKRELIEHAILGRESKNS